MYERARERMFSLPLVFTKKTTLLAIIGGSISIVGVRVNFSQSFHSPRRSLICKSGSRLKDVAHEEVSTRRLRMGCQHIRYKGSVMHKINSEWNIPEENCRIIVYDKQFMNKIKFKKTQFPSISSAH